jgi:hypothetical protein
MYMSILESQSLTPERTVEIYPEASGSASVFMLSGNEQQVDGAVSALLQSPVVAGGYTLQETATESIVGVPRVEPGTGGQIHIDSLPAEWVPLNEDTLRRVRPPLEEYDVRLIAGALAARGIRNCGDVIDGGLLGLSGIGLFKRELEVVVGLVKALTKLDRLPIGNER